MQVDYSLSVPPKEQRIEIASNLATEYVRLLGFDLLEESSQEYLEKTITFYSSNNNLLKTLEGLLEKARGG